MNDKMKRIICGIFVAVSVFLVSCYDDKGNYDYTTIENIVMTGMESEYSVVAPFDTLRISPQFAGKENYDCLWTLFPVAAVDAVPDTLSTLPDLEYPVVHEPNTYTLVLTVISKLNGDTQYFTSQVNVRSEFSVGCYILKEIEGGTDIDLYSPEFELAGNILHGMSGRVAGRPLSFAVCNDQTYLDEDGILNQFVKTVWICSDEDVRMLRLDNMDPIYDIHSMFVEEPEGEQPRNLFALGNSAMGYLSNNGYYDMQLIVMGTNKFGLPLSVRNASAGAPTNASGAHSILLGRNYCMFYDELNCRFLLVKNARMYCFLDTDITGVPTISPNNMNADLVYMGKTGSNGLALLENRTDHTRQLYRLETSEYDNTNNYLYSPLLEVEDVTSMSNMTNASVFGHNESFPYLYYANGSQLYMYDYSTKSEQSISLPEISGNITYIKDLTTDFFTGEDVEYFVVATEENGNYAIHFYQMLAGKPNLSADTHVITGEGSVKSIIMVE